MMKTKAQRRSDDGPDAGAPKAGKKTAWLRQLRARLFARPRRAPPAPPALVDERSSAPLSQRAPQSLGGPPGLQAGWRESHAARAIRSVRGAAAARLATAALSAGAVAAPAPKAAAAPQAVAPAQRAPKLTPGAFETRSFVDARGRLEFKLYTPKSYKGGAAPLLIMLHGCAQSPDDFAAATRMNALADEKGFVVAWPAQSRAANFSKCWNWFRAQEQTRGAGETGLIAALAQSLVAEFGLDATRVYVAGLSAGGAAAATLGQLYPDVFAGVAVHSGLACGAARDMGQAILAMQLGGRPRGCANQATPTIVIHGDQDGTVHPVNADYVRDQAIAGAPAAPLRESGEAGGLKFEIARYRDGAGRLIAEQWRVRGGAHAWFGGTAGGSYADARGPDASRAIWRFFEEVGPLSHRPG